MKKKYLVLEDGHVFEGVAFGADVETVGELVFNTGMVGYIETLTDPSYYGQIVLQTFPMIGNYGIIPNDFEGKPSLRGYVAREHCETPSNFRCEYTLDKFLKDNGIPGICGIDTRELTKIIRENGVVNATICDEVPSDLEAIKSFAIVDAVKNVTVAERTVFEADGDTKFNVTLVDYGTRKYLIDELCKRGCRVTVVPADTSAADILSGKVDGVLLSAGPGDPAENTEYVSCAEELFGKLPMLGIGLGHQILALANGGATYKLKFGHRGGNQPVKDSAANRTYITTQNHGYAVAANNVKNGVVSLINANDGSCEGIDYPDAKAFSVQFYPESISGAHSTSFVFDKFVELMGGNK